MSELPKAGWKIKDLQPCLILESQWGIYSVWFLEKERHTHVLYISSSSDNPMSKALNKNIDIETVYYGKIGDFEVRRVGFQTVKVFDMGYIAALALLCKIIKCT